MLNERLCNEGLPINFDCLAFFRHASKAQRTSVIAFHPLWKILPLWPGLKPTTLCKAEASGIQYDSVGNQIVSLTRFCPTRLSVFRQNGWLRLEILLHCIFCSYILKWTSRFTVIFFVIYDTLINVTPSYILRRSSFYGLHALWQILRCSLRSCLSLVTWEHM